MDRNLLKSVFKMQQVQPRLSETSSSSKMQTVRDFHNDQAKVFWSQRLASFLLSFLLLLAGLTSGWSSPYLAQLMIKENTDGISRATENELTWLATLMNVARIFGTIVGAVAQDCIGRKWCLYFAGVPMICGWVSAALAVNVQWLYAFRILCGLSSGMAATTLSNFLAEIADPQIRGSLILWNTACIGIGIFVGNTMGPYISIRTYAYIAIGINILFLGSFVMIPDSPYHYIAKGNTDKAESSLKWFRRSKNVKNEFLELQDFLSHSKATFKQSISELKQARYRKSFLLMFLINIFLFFGANNVLTNYMEILITMSEVPVNAGIVVSVIGFSCTVAALLATLLIDIFGRRRLMIIASVVNALALASLGLHFHLLKLGFNPVSLTWLPCICLLLSAISFHGGTGCVPKALVGELFSPALKTLGNFCFNVTAAIFACISTATFLPLFTLIGLDYLFWFYASGICTSTMYYYFCMPETMGKSLKEIQKQ